MARANKEQEAAEIAARTEQQHIKRAAAHQTRGGVPTHPRTIERGSRGGARLVMHVVRARSMHGARCQRPDPRCGARCRRCTVQSARCEGWRYRGAVGRCTVPGARCTVQLVHGARVHGARGSVIGASESVGRCTVPGARSGNVRRRDGGGMGARPGGVVWICAAPTFRAFAPAVRFRAFAPKSGKFRAPWSNRFQVPWDLPPHLSRPHRCTGTGNRPQQI